MQTEAPAAAELIARAGRLGFRPEDVADLATTAEDWLTVPANRAALLDRADRLRSGIGRLRVDGDDPWDGLGEGPDDGLLPILALLTTADDVVAYLRGRGVSEPDAWRDLSDLGQQVWVHRLTYGRFGLHTQGWLRIAWAGSFAWLGRLQFNLEHLADGGPTGAGEWVLCTHIPRRSSDDDGPRSGALTAAAVDDSFRRATAYFARHYPDLPTTDFWCHSWLLAPELAEALPGTNIAAFQQRWTLTDHVGDGDDDAIFFTFARRPPLDPATLPRGTSLERAVLGRLEAGQHWSVRSGRIPQSPSPDPEVP